MAFDGVVTHAVAWELEQKLQGGKIDKIYQPEKDEIIISVRCFGHSYRLLMSASASCSRIHLTNVEKDNPASPPMFCMLLRKHIAGGRIIKINQSDFDRVIKIDIESYTELGDLSVKTLIVEVMGKHSNIIVTDNSGKIMDAIKHIDFTVSAKRQILPGLYYENPPGQDKINPLTAGAKGTFDILSKHTYNIRFDKLILDRFMGISPLIARELVFRCFGNTQVIFSEGNADKLVLEVINFFNDIQSNSFSPTIVYNKVTKKPMAFYCFSIMQYEESAYSIQLESISEAIDTYFREKDFLERISQKTYALIKLINNNIERCEKKISLHRENLDKSKDRGKYKIYGDLLTANIYRIKYGMKNIEVENYYDAEGASVEIALKENISPSQNAQRYYTLYNKAKITEKYAQEQFEAAEKELKYLDSVLEAAKKAENTTEIAEIREELVEEGYLTRKVEPKKKKLKISAPMKFISSDGFTILVGKNNKQNDILTMKTSYSTDIWLHAKNIPGSHTVIRTEGGRMVPAQTLTEAANLAAYYSKGKNSSNVPVDYTEIKNVKKPTGAKPGFVIYENYNTIYVTPEEFRSVDKEH